MIVVAVEYHERFVLTVAFVCFLQLEVGAPNMLLLPITWHQNRLVQNRGSNSSA